MVEGKDILFMGIGKSAVLWYRCVLPALHLGADWVGVRGVPPGVTVLTGLVRGDTVLPHYDDYKVVVIQQPSGRAWLTQINAMKKRGIKVLYECDDYLHGVPKQRGHDFARNYTKEVLKGHELCMRVCDGMICSTEYIARRYAKFNRNVFVCDNGIDLNRYKLTPPKRDTINVGWAGATGHMHTLAPWLNGLIEMMQAHKEMCFVSIGQPGLAQPVNQLLGSQRSIGIPFAPLECYPAAMCMFDIALAPAGRTAWYRGKSDLRWLEAGALGIPVIADPLIYPEIEHGVTGFHAESASEMSEVLATVIADDDLRSKVGANARDYIERHRASDITGAQWFEVCNAVVGEYESAHQI